jgi:hypothetical protein
MKPYGFRTLRNGDCPACGMPFGQGNARTIMRRMDDLHADEGLCMFCGATEGLSHVTVWTGMAIEGEKIDPDITWMGLVVLVPGRREVKVIQVESFTYRVCPECSAKKLPESHAQKERSDRDPKNAYFEAQREPFDAGIDA